jgi:hypothetical protein
MAGWRFHELRKPAVHGHSGYLLPSAKILIALSAKLALTAGPVNPGNADAFADLEVADALAILGDAAGNLMAEDQGFLCNASKLRPISIRKMQVRVTDSAGLYLDQQIAFAYYRTRNVFERQRLFEFMKYGSSHRSSQEMTRTVGSGLCSLEEKSHCAANPLAQIVRRREIDGPVPNRRAVKCLHELGQVRQRKNFRNLSSLLTLFQDFRE